MQVNEKDIQRQIVDWLRLKGWFVAETSQKGFSFATPGLPDVIATKSAGARSWATRTVWIEVKGPRGTQRDTQAEFQAGLEAQGGTYLLVRSLDDVMEAL